MKRYCSNANKMVDNAAIKAAILARMQLQEFAELIGISYHTLRFRLIHGDWSVLEAYKVCRALDLDFEKTFFAFPEEGAA